MKNKTKREREQNYIIGMITTKKLNKTKFLFYILYVCVYVKIKYKKITLILLLYNTNKKILA